MALNVFIIIIIVLLLLLRRVKIFTLGWRLRAGHYRLSSIFVLAPGTMRPSNNTVSSANGGQMSVLYNSRFVGPSIRAKTLNPLFNWLDQFSSTHIPLQHSRIMTGYIHFILKFTRKQTANKSEAARRAFSPNFRPRPARDPTGKRRTYIQIKAAAADCGSTSNHFSARLRVNNSGFK